MDAVKFFKAQERMCLYHRKHLGGCSDCPIGVAIDSSDIPYKNCNDFIHRCPNQSVSMVEAWIKEHPAKTRQQALLEMFPNIFRYDNGVLTVCPQNMDTGIICCTTCYECCKNFWTREIE